jgi:D-threonate/D-erythronate kinase
VVADDLTGACDAGVAFAPAVVALCAEVKLEAGDALVESTHSRGEDPAVAAARVEELMQRLPRADLLYMKIDSMLRGNLRAELEAMLPASQRPRAVVCPAFPEQGRVVIEGVSKPADVDLRVLLAGLPVEIPEAQTSEDLVRISGAYDPARFLLVGSAGLARVVGKVPRRMAMPSAPGPGAALLFVGSIHPVTLTQLDSVEAEDAEVWRIEMASPDPAQLSALRHRVADLDAGGLMMCGGDTALLVCRLLGAEGIRLEAEIEPGVPFGRLIGGVGDGLAVVTKSGGFGTQETVACIARVLSVQNRKSA